MLVKLKPQEIKKLKTKQQLRGDEAHDEKVDKNIKIPCRIKERATGIIRYSIRS
jgi:hypothetical protein